MRKANLLSILVAGISVVGVSSCKNGDADFPNYDNSAVYFAYQTPVRTLVMGEDTYPTELDNEHKCKIYATMGGAYGGSGSTVIDIMVDESLCENLYFEDGVTPVKAMPSNYYTLASEQITLNENNNLMGGVEVQFTNDFFNDEASLTNSYVIPIRMTDVVNADKCMGCMRCVAYCPRSARKIPAEKYAFLDNMLQKVATERKTAELFC